MVRGARVWDVPRANGLQLVLSTSPNRSIRARPIRQACFGWVTFHPCSGGRCTWHVEIHVVRSRPRRCRQTPARNALGCVGLRLGLLPFRPFGHHRDDSSFSFSDRRDDLPFRPDPNPGGSLRPLSRRGRCVTFLPSSTGDARFVVPSGGDGPFAHVTIRQSRWPWRRRAFAHLRVARCTCVPLETPGRAPRAKKHA